VALIKVHCLFKWGNILRSTVGRHSNSIVVMLIIMDRYLRVEVIGLRIRVILRSLSHTPFAVATYESRSAQSKITMTSACASISLKLAELQVLHVQDVFPTKVSMRYHFDCIKTLILRYQSCFQSLIYHSRGLPVVCSCRQRVEQTS
jgi:hypothetical protein